MPINSQYLDKIGRLLQSKPKNDYFEHLQAQLSGSPLKTKPITPKIPQETSEQREQSVRRTSFRPYKTYAGNGRIFERP